MQYIMLSQQSRRKIDVIIEKKTFSKITISDNGVGMDAKIQKQFRLMIVEKACY